MSTVGNITNSLASSLLSSMFSGSTPSTSAQGSVSTGIASDIVSLLGDSSSSANSSIYSILGGGQGSGSTDPTYGILLSAENASMMQADPGLIGKILSAGQGTSTSTGSTTSGTGTQALVKQLETMNLLTMSPNSLFSLLEDKLASQASSNATSGSKVSTTA